MMVEILAFSWIAKQTRPWPELTYPRIVTPYHYGSLERNKLGQGLHVQGWIGMTSSIDNDKIMTSIQLHQLFQTLYMESQHNILLMSFFLDHGQLRQCKTAPLIFGS
jgi:hypothetical protein